MRNGYRNLECCYSCISGQPYIRAGGRFYPEWYTGTDPNLRTPAGDEDDIGRRGYKVSAGRATINGPNVAIIPWVSCRIYGDDTTITTKHNKAFM